MCGFVTAISKADRKFDEKTLCRMSEMIVHRGPDDNGVFFEKDWLSMAFRRLSILDLSEQGHQPMLSSDGKAVIVYNGEVYNYRELRADLESEGCEFKSGSDTEVVLAAYRKWGEKALSRFIGMFAFVYADFDSKEVHVVRDQLGIKPLYCYEDGDYFILSSEVKALIPYCSLEPDFFGMNDYLVFRAVAGETTLFKKVHSILPGSIMKIYGGSAVVEQYFDLASTFTEKSELSFEAACEKVEAELKRSVDIHLRSDVELGVQLSGGVDSSLIAALASERLGGNLHSFSISYDGGSCDESKYQQYVSDRYNTTHHDYRLDERTLCGGMADALWHYGMPLNDPNTVATYYLCGRSKKHVTVMLSGEGADESYHGYSRYMPEVMRRLSKMQYLHERPALRKAVRAVWPFHKSIFAASRYDPVMYAHSVARQDAVDALLDGDDYSMSYRHAVAASAGGDISAGLALQDQVCYLAPWLQRADTMGMAYSQELRVPFCTVPMFAAGNSLSYDVKVHGGERKAVLKKLAERYLAHDLIYRKKIGFNVPVGSWSKKGPYREFLLENLESVRSKKRSYVNMDHFEMIYSGFLSGKYHERMLGFLWSYANLELWYRMYIEGER